jgi:nucleoside-diphosphate-sugar epimerase
MKIAIVGANGYVGSSICKALIFNSNHQLVSVLRGDEIKSKLELVDVVIHAANPAKRFKAETDPEYDFCETLEKTFNLLKISRGKKFFLISSLSCRTQLNTNYGRNRRACELLALEQGGIVIRLGPMYGGARKQDALHDLLVGKPIYVAPETRYGYVDVDWVGQKIIKMFDLPSDIYEIGASNSVSFAELRDFFSSTSSFSGSDDTQIPITNDDDAPDARMVFAYAKKELETSFWTK